MVTSGLANPRAMRVAPNGDLFLADSMSNTVRLYRIPQGSAKPTDDEVFASGLHQPFGIAFYPLGPNPEWVYVANSNGLVRFRYKSGDLKATGQPESIVEQHSGGLITGRVTSCFRPTARRLFLSVGSGSNVALDMFPEPHLAMVPAPHIVKGLAGVDQDRIRSARRGTPRSVARPFFPSILMARTRRQSPPGCATASGCTVIRARATCTAASTSAICWATTLPPDYLTRVPQGAFFGWPWYYIGSNEEPRLKGIRPDLKDQVRAPDLLVTAHSAPLGMVVYEAAAAAPQRFPAEYNGDMFLALHGSWNRTTRTGSKVVRVFMKDGVPSGSYQDFMTGFVLSDREVWGRPSSVAVQNDGSLLVVDDVTGEIWRVSYQRGWAAVTAPYYTDNLMHDLKTKRFYKPVTINGMHAAGDGAIKTFVLRGIKDSPPYMHDGRYRTLRPRGAIESNGWAKSPCSFDREALAHRPKRVALDHLRAPDALDNGSSHMRQSHRTARQKHRVDVFGGKLCVSAFLHTRPDALSQFHGVAHQIIAVDRGASGLHPSERHIELLCVGQCDLGVLDVHRQRVATLLFEHAQRSNSSG